MTWDDTNLLSTVFLIYLRFNIIGHLLILDFYFLLPLLKGRNAFVQIVFFHDKYQIWGSLSPKKLFSQVGSMLVFSACECVLSVYSVQEVPNHTKEMSLVVGDHNKLLKTPADPRSNVALNSHRDKSLQFFYNDHQDLLYANLLLVPAESKKQPLQSKISREEPS